MVFSVRMDIRDTPMPIGIRIFDLKKMKQTIHEPVSQSFPVKPGGQRHLYDVPWWRSTHVPPLIQGVDLHWLISKNLIKQSFVHLRRRNHDDLNEHKMQQSRVTFCIVHYKKLVGKRSLTCFTIFSSVSLCTLTAISVHLVCARPTVLARIWRAIIDI